MVRVGSWWAQGFEQAPEAPLAVILEADGEVRSAERRQQIEAGYDELPDRWKVHDAIGREATEQRVDGRRPGGVERAEHRHAPQGLTVEHVRVVGAAGVLAQPSHRGRATADDHHGVRGRSLVTEERPQLIAA